MNLHYRHLSNPFDTYTLIDPDFDELGGELTFHQIIDPIPTTETEAYSGQYHRLHQRRAWQELKHKRHRLEWAVTRLRRNLFHWQRDKLTDLTYRLLRQRLREYPRFRFGDNWICNCCIPYNGHHTPNYWGTGQPDCW